MTLHERIYRALLLAHPRRHRHEYGEAMVQMMRDRMRDDGGGRRSLLVWVSLLVDLVRSASVERFAVVRAGFRAGWWQAAAVVDAGVLAVAGLSAMLEPATGPWYNYTLGRLALLAAPVVIVTGLLLRRLRRRQGSALVAVGLAPGAFAIVLFWSPPFLLFGLSSIAVIFGALDDVDHTRRAAPDHWVDTTSSTAWPSPADPSKERQT